jgi:hypothetical protein
MNVRLKLADNNLENPSCAFVLIYRQRAEIAKKSNNKVAHPIKPSSSALTAKIKSVACAGKKDR